MIRPYSAPEVVDSDFHFPKLVGYHFLMLPHSLRHCLREEFPQFYAFEVDHSEVSGVLAVLKLSDGVPESDPRRELNGLRGRIAEVHSEQE